MNELHFELSDEEEWQLRALADEAQAQVDQDYRSRPWEEAGVEFFQAEQAAGRDEMTTLMEILSITPPLSQSQVHNLIDLAVHAFLGIGPGDATVTTVSPEELCMEVKDCPAYRRVLGEQVGITACSCFARRAGWYEAFGKTIRDDQEANRKWGDERCRVTIHLNAD